MKSHIWSVAVCFSALMILTAGCNRSGAVKSSSPQEAFDNFTKAAEKEDWKTALSTLTPKCKNEFTGMLAFMASMSKNMANMMPPGMMEGLPEGMADGMQAELNKQKQMVQEVSKKITGVLDKHGVTDEMLGGLNMMSDPGAVATIGSKIKNQAGFVKDIVNLLNSMDGDAPKMEFGKATISDIKIDGDNATASVTVDGAPQPVEFKKIDGTWLMEFGIE